MLILTLPDGPRFSLGRVYATPGALAALGDDEETQNANFSAILSRHLCGDWGELCADDRQANEAALQHGRRLLSAYTVRGTKVWVITEADRASTTALLPEEY